MPDTKKSPESGPQKARKGLFKPGQSGNPAGRPKGARSKLGEAFLKKLEADFKKHGEEVIEAVRVDKPDVYLKVVAQIVPKQMTHTVSQGLEGLLRDLHDKRPVIDITPEVEVVSDDIRSGGVRSQAGVLPSRGSHTFSGETKNLSRISRREDD